MSKENVKELMEKLAADNKGSRKAFRNPIKIKVRHRR